MNRKEKIVSVLVQYPEGIHFNALYREVKKDCSTQTLVNILRELEEEGLVTKQPKTPRKGQKVFYKNTTASKKLAEDLTHLQDLYELHHLKLIISDYFAECGHKFNLSFSPGAMQISFGQGLVNSVLLANLYSSTKYKGKTRRDLQEKTIKIFLAIQDEYFQFLRRHPKIKAKVMQHIDKEAEKAAKQMRKAVEAIREKGSDFFFQKVLSQEEKHRMIKDFTEWIETKEIEDKNNIKDYFKSWLLVFETS